MLLEALIGSIILANSSINTEHGTSELSEICHTIWLISPLNNHPIEVNKLPSTPTHSSKTLSKSLTQSIANWIKHWHVFHNTLGKSLTHWRAIPKALVANLLHTVLKSLNKLNQIWPCTHNLSRSCTVDTSATYRSMDSCQMSCCDSSWQSECVTYETAWLLARKWWAGWAN